MNTLTAVLLLAAGVAAAAPAPDTPASVRADKSHIRADRAAIRADDADEGVQLRNLLSQERAAVAAVKADGSKPQADKDAAIKALRADYRAKRQAVRARARADRRAKRADIKKDREDIRKAASPAASPTTDRGAAGAGR